MSLKLSDTKVYEPQIRARLGNHTTTKPVSRLDKRTCRGYRPQEEVYLNETSFPFGSGGSSRSALLVTGTGTGTKTGYGYEDRVRTPYGREYRRVLRTTRIRRTTRTYDDPGKAPLQTLFKSTCRRCLSCFTISCQLLYNNTLAVLQYRQGSRRWRSNSPGNSAYERPTRGRVNSTIRRACAVLALVVWQ